MSHNTMSDEAVCQAAADYAGGVPIRRLAIQHGVSSTTMKRKLQGAGVVFRSQEEAQKAKGKRRPEERLTEEQLQQAVIMYGSKNGLATVAAHFGFSRMYLRELFRRRGVLVKERSAARRKYDLNEDSFARAPESPEACYWVGMLLADGCVVRSGNQASVRLSLSGEDGPHVARFRNFLSASHPVKEIKSGGGFSGSQPCHRIQFNSAKIAADLAKHGVGPTKSLTAKPSAAMAGSRDFWRGVVDGDGWLTVCYHADGREVPVIGCCGSLPTIEAFCKFVWDRVSVLVGPNPNGKRNWQTKVAGCGAALLAKILYADCCVALPRKFAAAQEFIRAARARGSGRAAPSRNSRR